MPRRPKTHQLSLIAFTTGCGALLLLPFSVWEFSTGFTLKFDALTLATLTYVVIFPSTLAYLFFNRGIALIGPNRAAPFFSSGAGVRLGDGDPAPRRAAAAVSSGRLPAGAGGRGDRVAAGIGRRMSTRRCTGFRFALRQAKPVRQRSCQKTNFGGKRRYDRTIETVRKQTWQSHLRRQNQLLTRTECRTYAISSDRHNDRLLHSVEEFNQG